MARVGRIAGALLVETGGEHYLVGNTKMPCDWEGHGFERPEEIDATRRPYVALRRSGTVEVGVPHLVVDLEGEELARELARRMLVERNGSVSERLWRLAIGADGVDDPPAGPVAARWLVEMPEPIWRMVRDSVLRCL
jgi:hypothetical protein